MSLTTPEPWDTELDIEGSLKNATESVASAFSRGGILLTLGLNSVFCLLMVIVFCAICRNFTVFNSRKKRRLIELIKEEHHFEQEQLQEVEEDELHAQRPPDNDGNSTDALTQGDIAAASANDEPPSLPRFRHGRSESLDGGEIDQILLDEERERIDAQVHSLGFDDQQVYFSRLLGLDASRGDIPARRRHRRHWSRGFKLPIFGQRDAKESSLADHLISNDFQSNLPSGEDGIGTRITGDQLESGLGIRSGDAVQLFESRTDGTDRIGEDRNGNDHNIQSSYDSPILQHESPEHGTSEEQPDAGGNNGPNGPSAPLTSSSTSRSKSWALKFRKKVLRAAILVWESFKFVAVIILGFVSPRHNRKDTQFLFQKYGRDVAVYFKFQKEIIVATIACTLLGLIVLLPLHITGTAPVVEVKGPNGYTLAEEDYPLIHTTIAMVLNSPLKLYIHVALAFAFVMIYAVALYRFMVSDVVRKKDAFQDEDDVVQSLRSVMIADYCAEVYGLPRDFVDGHSFEHAVRTKLAPHSDVRKVVFLLNVHKRIVLHRKLQKANDKIEHFQFIKSRQESRMKRASASSSSIHPEYRPRTTVVDFSDFKFPFIGISIDALTYYQSKRRKYLRQIAEYDWKLAKTIHEGRVLKEEKEPIYGTGRAWIIFNNVKDARLFRARNFTGIRSVTTERIEDKELSSFVLPNPLRQEAANDKVDEIEVCFDAEKDEAVDSRSQPPDHVFPVTTAPAPHYAPRTRSDSDATTTTTSATVSRSSSVSNGSSSSIGNSKEDILAQKSVASISDEIKFRVQRPYEPNDVDITNFFTYNRLTDPLRNLSIEIATILVLIFFSTPLSGVSAVQRLLEFDLLTPSIKDVLVSITGEFGNAVFIYLPTLLMHLFTVLIPYTLWYLAVFAKYKSKSRYKRKVIWRMYLYLTISTLIMPSFMLTSVNGVVISFNSEKSFVDLLNRIFVPTSGAFFTNFLLQQALLKNFEDLIRLGNLCYYLWGRLFAKTPKEILLAAELADFYMEYEYAYMLSIMSIGITYSVFTPVVLVAALLYLCIKQVTDRYVFYFIYGHKSIPRSILTGDMHSNHKLTQLICRLMLINLALLPAGLFVFFLSKSRENFQLIPHTVLCALLVVFIAVYTFASYATRGDLITKHMVGYFDRLLAKRPTSSGQQGPASEEGSPREVTEDNTGFSSALNMALDSAYETPIYVRRIVNDPAMVARILAKGKP